MSRIRAAIGCSSALCLMVMLGCGQALAYSQYVLKHKTDDPGNCRYKVRTELGLAPYTGYGHPQFGARLRACLARAGLSQDTAGNVPAPSRSVDDKAEARKEKRAEQRAKQEKLAARSTPDRNSKPAPAPVQQGNTVHPPPLQQTLAVPSATPSPAASFGRRVALVIGNSDYAKVPSLPNAVNDAGALASTLRATGFQSVTLKTNLTRDQTVAALSEFATLADGADWAAVYYSGHGIEYRGMNYVIPTDAKLKVDRDIDLEAVDVGKFTLAIDSAKRLKLVILDACRDNPFAEQMKRTVATRSLSRGLARIEPEAGTLIVYSAKHGEVALDGTGSNSPFTTALLKRIQTPNVELRRVFDLVRDDVMAATERRQQPFSYGSLSGSEDFYFLTKQ